MALHGDDHNGGTGWGETAVVVPSRRHRVWAHPLSRFAVASIVVATTGALLITASSAHRVAAIGAPEAQSRSAASAGVDAASGGSDGADLAPTAAESAAAADADAVPVTAVAGTATSGSSASSRPTRRSTPSPAARCAGRREPGSRADRGPTGASVGAQDGSTGSDCRGRRAATPRTAHGGRGGSHAADPAPGYRESAGPIRRGRRATDSARPGTGAFGRDGLCAATHESAAALPAGPAAGRGNRSDRGRRPGRCQTDQAGQEA